MRNLDLLPASKFHCTTKMEVVKEISRVRDDRLDFLGTFEEHRKALLHVLKNTSAITAAVLREDYLRRIVETYFGLKDNITSMVVSMDVHFKRQNWASSVKSFEMPLLRRPNANGSFKSY